MRRTRKFFTDLQQTFIDWNGRLQKSPEFAATRELLLKKISEAPR